MTRTSIVTLALAAAASTSLAGIELTTNGGFEAGDTSGWVSFPTSSSTFNVTNDSNSGTFGAEIFNNAGASGAVVKQANLGIGIVNSGDIITISFAAKGEGAIGGVAFAEFFSEIDGGGVSSSTLLGGAPLALTNEYQTFNFSIAAGPDVSGGVTLQFAAVTGADIGSVIVLFIDDVSVSVVPAPGAMAVMGLGGLLAVRRRR
jgi:MYXO-CTERM domain-containing protein